MRSRQTQLPQYRLVNLNNPACSFSYTAGLGLREQVNFIFISADTPSGTFSVLITFHILRDPKSFWSIYSIGFLQSVKGGKRIIQLRETSLPCSSVRYDARTVGPSVVRSRTAFVCAGAAGPDESARRTKLRIRFNSSSVSPVRLPTSEVRFGV